MTRLDNDCVQVRCTGGCGRTFTVLFTSQQEKAWKAGALIQALVAEQRRELLISGTCDQCWDKLFEGESL